MNLSLKNKTALVCGSSAGIGKAAALELAVLGANVILMARNKAKLEAVKALLPCAEGQKHTYVVVDFNDTAAVASAMEALAQNPIHIVVNNTGGPDAGAITEAKPSAFIAAFNQHLICNQIIATAVLPGMKAEGYGRIINVISTSVKIPLNGLGVSNTVRGAVANWAKTWANEVAGFGITVNNVLPGATETDRLAQIFETKAQKTGQAQTKIEESMRKQIPMGRFAEPSEIAHAIAFLASPSASYITGINLPVDGGRTGCL